MWKIIQFLSPIMKKYIYLITLLIIPTLSAMELTCTHPQVCKMMDELLKDQGVKIVPELIVQGDPHHFEPRPHQIKPLLKAQFLIGPAISQQPWLKKVTGMRRPDKSYMLPSFKSGDHFWLNPKHHCMAKNIYYQQLMNWFPVPKIIIKCQHTKTEKKWRELNTKKFGLILTHDALIPWLEKLNIRYFSLDSGKHQTKDGHKLHHKGLTPQLLKNLEKQLSLHKKWIWIKEKGFPFPNALRKMANPNNIIEWDPQGTYPSTNGPLETLFDIIEQHEFIRS
jgi:hypothetical protein